MGRGRESERLDRGNRPKKTGETVDRRQNNGSVKAVSPRHCPATCALRNCCSNCCAGHWVTKTMSVAPLLMNNLDNSKQKTSNLLSPAPSPYSWSLLSKCEGPAPPPSSKISWSFGLAWNPETRRAQGASFNTSDNWGHEIPPNQKRERTTGKKVKVSPWPGTHTLTVSRFGLAVSGRT